MSVWFKEYKLQELEQVGRQTMVEHLGIVLTEAGDDYLKARMPVDQRTKQPAGLLHGGASVALAETLGSFASYMCVDPQKYDCVGLEINANHIRQVRQGFVTGTARPLHLGRRTQLWEIKITDEKNRLVCVSRITLAVLEKMDEA